MRLFDVVSLTENVNSSVDSVALVGRFHIHLNNCLDHKCHTTVMGFVVFEPIAASNLPGHLNAL